MKTLEKTCSKCGALKHISKFPRSSRSDDGRSAVCLVCRKRFKQCCRCKQTKAIDEFHRDRTKADGHITTCKPCKLAYKAKWQRANPDKCRQYTKAWQERNPEEYKERMRMYEYQAYLRKQLREVDLANWYSTPYEALD